MGSETSFARHLQTATHHRTVLDVVAAVVGLIVFAPGVRVFVGGEDPIFYALEILGGAAWIAAVVRYARHDRRPLRFTTVTTAVLWVVLLGASIVGVEPFVSLGIARVTILATGIAWAVAAVSPDLDRWRFAGIAAASGVLLHSARLFLEVSDKTGGTFVIESSERGEIQLLGGSLNNAASVLLIAMPFLLILILRTRGAVRLLGGVSLLVATWAIATSASRALTWSVALIIGFFVAAVVVSGVSKHRLAIAVTAIAFVLGALLSAPSVGAEVASWWPDGSSTGSGEVIDEIPDDAGETEDREARNRSSDLHRSEYFALAWEEFRANPIIGAGFHLRTSGGARAGFAHNYALELLASTGVIGLVATTAVGLAYVAGWWANRRSEIMEKIIAIGGLLAGGAVSMVQPFLNTGHVFAVLWWLLLALGVGVVTAGATRHDDHEQVPVDAAFSGSGESHP